MRCCIKPLKLKHCADSQKWLIKEVRRRARQFQQEQPRETERLTARPRSMRRVDYVRFRLLQRQFEGNNLPGLASAVRVAHFVWNRVKKRGGDG